MGPPSTFGGDDDFSLGFFFLVVFLGDCGSVWAGFFFFFFFFFLVGSRSLLFKRSTSAAVVFSFFFFLRTGVLGSFVTSCRSSGLSERDLRVCEDFVLRSLICTSTLRILREWVEALFLNRLSERPPTSPGGGAMGGGRLLDRLVLRARLLSSIAEVTDVGEKDNAAVCWFWVSRQTSSK